MWGLSWGLHYYASLQGNKVMTLERAGRYYGDGVLLGNDGYGFVDLEPVEQAKQLGWSVACPVVLRLIDQRGAKEMANRYGEVLMWSGVVAEMLERGGLGDIKAELVNTVSRNDGELMGKHDENWPPTELESMMFGPASPEGYAIPRLVTSFIGDHVYPKDLEAVGEKSNRAMYAIGCIEEAIAECDASRDLESDSRDEMHRGYEYQLTEFTVVLTELLSDFAGEHYGVEVGEFFHQLIGTGKLSEDNCRARYRNIVNVMHDVAPRLHKKYVELSPEQVSKHRVAMIEVDF